MNLNFQRVLVLAFILTSCVQPDTQKAAVQLSQVLPKSCVVDPAAEAFNDPESIDELMNLINALPKPLTADCLIKSLKRPLYITATSSTLSAQPAASQSSPRIFIFKGDLTISIVPTGEGSKIIEFSELTSSMRSIKGELSLPVLQNLASTAAYSRINTIDQTSCSGCHNGERLEETKDGVPVYSSVAFRPPATKIVSMDVLKEYQYVCQTQKNTFDRCLVFNALFSTGEVIEKPFSEDLSLFINSFGF